jgi:hypothetical protein
MFQSYFFIQVVKLHVVLTFLNPQEIMKYTTLQIKRKMWTTEGNSSLHNMKNMFYSILY